MKQNEATTTTMMMIAIKMVNIFNSPRLSSSIQSKNIKCAKHFTIKTMDVVRRWENQKSQEARNRNEFGSLKMIERWKIEQTVDHD